MAGINWLGLLQPQDETLPAQPGGCAQCHAGLGAKPNLPPTEDDLANVDCLICHSPDYERVPAKNEADQFEFVPAEGLDILAVAQAAQRPTSEMCSRCHLGASGGPNFKHGDYPTSPEVDVHMAAGLQCVDCHTSQNHKIAGGGYMIAQELPDEVVACTNCHADGHQGENAAFLNMHTNRVACQTCHIPLIARDPDYPTQMTRDYTQSVLNEATGLYGPQIGKENDVVPTYFWWDSHRMETPPKPVGSIEDSAAQITPWKPMEVTVPFDAETDTPIYIKQGAYKISGDLDAAITAGLEASGQEYSGEWEPVTELMYFDANHQVAPAAESLKCADCHSDDGRLDFAALGYSEDRIAGLLAVGAPPPAPAEEPTAEPTEEVVEEEPVVEEPATEEEPTAEPAPATGFTSNDQCLACHGAPDFTTELPSGEILYLTIDPDTYAHSVHGAQGYACIQCHTDIEGFPHDPITAANRREFVFQRYLSSCVECHPDNYETTLDSVHQKELAAGNTHAAVCTDCHGAHDVAPPDEPISRESQMCERCQSTIYDYYQESVHGAALIGEGNLDVPSCTDCHGVHDVEGPSAENSFHLLSEKICAECHNDPALMSRYGLNADVYETYIADFHGTTVKLFEQISPEQKTNKPVCIDCHGVHDILSHENPNSTVIKENLLETCQRCHPEATLDFPASWLSHYRPDTEKAPIVYFVDLFYKILIPAVIGGMVIFNATDMYRRIVNRLRGGKEQGHG